MNRTERESETSAVARGVGLRMTRKDLRWRLEAVAESHRDAESMAARRALVALLRGWREAGLETLRTRLHANPKRGRACALSLGELHDEMLTELYRFVERHISRRANPSEAERLCMVAVGGYGRGTLAPFSDLDLLFLHPYKPTPWEEALVEHILLALWDVGLSVGHATRSVEGCLAVARGHLATRTALLDARPLAGDKALFADWQERFRAQSEAQEGGAAEDADFIDAKLAERDERHRRFGASRYLVEPNIKESKGGLRDLDVLLWLAKHACGVSKQSGLLRAGLFTQGEYARLRDCWNFLWAVRCELHFWARRAEDRLGFEAQLHIADVLGYRKLGGLSAVECFMKRYYKMARETGQLTRILCARLEEKGKKRPPLARAGVADARRSPAFGKDLGADFILVGGRLNASGDDIFARDGCNFVRLFLLRSRCRAALHPHLVTLLASELHRITADLRRNDEANRLFLECLLCGDAAAILREMNETGMLGRFIPEFGRVVGQMQFGMYHHYTVDEHSLRALEELRALETDDNKELPLASSLAKRSQNRAALSLAVFLHDIAKGSKRDHSIAGERIVRSIAARLHLPRAEGELAAWLVRNHLLMNHFAQKRDIHDARTIEDFVAQVVSSERLRLLLLLTVADIRAVGPGVWNGWKGALLRRLYHIAEARLTGHSSALSLQESEKRAQEALARQLRHWPPARLRKHLARFPADYWSAFDTPEHERHALMIAEADTAHAYGGDYPLEACLQITPDRFRSATGMVCYQKDRSGLFAAITGACARANVSIADARIFTTNDGMALEVLRLCEANGGALLERWRLDSLRRSVETALAAGGGGVQDEAWSQARPRLPAIWAQSRICTRGQDAFAHAGKVWIDNDLSAQRSVIEISGLDRAGLLHDLARALLGLGLQVVSAHVATFGERASDVFYVREEDGGKIEGAARQQKVKEHLLAAVLPRTGHALACDAGRTPADDTGDKSAAGEQTRQSYLGDAAPRTPRKREQRPTPVLRRAG